MSSGQDKLPTPDIPFCRIFLHCHAVYFAQMSFEVGGAHDRETGLRFSFHYRIELIVGITDGTHFALMGGHMLVASIMRTCTGQEFSVLNERGSTVTLKHLVFSRSEK